MEVALRKLDQIHPRKDSLTTVQLTRFESRKITFIS